MELLDLSGQQGDRLLELVEPVLDIDRVDALGAGRGRQQERDREQRDTELVHGGRQFECKRGHFQAWPLRLQMKTPVAWTGVSRILGLSYCSSVTARRLRAHAASSEPTGSGRSLP